MRLVKGRDMGIASAERNPPLLPAGTDVVALVLVLGAFLAMFVPTYLALAEEVWSTDEQGHGPIILAVSLWLLFQQRHELAQIPARPSPLAGWTAAVVAMLLYFVGVSQNILLFQGVAQIVFIAATFLLFRGWSALRAAWFPLFFLLFMVPLPGALVALVTTPLKAAVSTVAEFLLFHGGYPVARAGVVLTVGQYQLMVADACAGLNSMFTLEALGLLYMKLMRYDVALRNVILAISVIPIAFAANVVRVMILVLVTYHLGDEAGQGFVHGFAGMVLFMAGLVMLLGFDKLLSVIGLRRYQHGSPA